MPRKQEKAAEDDSTKQLDLKLLETPALDSRDLRMSYRIARGEQGVLTFEPYKSILLPYWRFKTVPIAEQSSKNLKQAFDHYVAAQDLPGADMARKFVQMGMTRAKRYANHKGGRKYDRTEREVEAEGGSRTELPKSQGHDGQDEKLQASEIFKVVWRNCTSDQNYLDLKADFMQEQKEWDRAQSKVKKEVVKEEGPIKQEPDGDD